MTRRLIYTQRAHLDRESIALYLGIEQGLPQAAKKTLKAIDAAIERICEFPDSGGRISLDGLRGGECRTAHADPYTIYYRFDADTLTVCRILHQRRELDTYTIVNLLEP